MREITDKEYEMFQRLLKIWKHSSPEKTGAYFICGEGGNHKDVYGLPDIILVCPHMGENVTAIYTKKSVGRSGQ